MRFKENIKEFFESNPFEFSEQNELAAHMYTLRPREIEAVLDRFIDKDNEKKIKGSPVYQKGVCIFPEAIKHRIIPGVVKINIHALYTRLMIHCDDLEFNYSRLKELMNAMLMIREGLDADSIAYKNYQIFMNNLYGNLANDRTPGAVIVNENGTLPMYEYYIKMMTDIIKFILGRGFFIYYIDTDEIWVSQDFLDDKISQMMLKSLYSVYVGKHPDIAQDDNEYLFIGRKKYVQVADSKGCAKMTNTPKFRQRVQNEILDTLDEVYNNRNPYS